MTPAEQIAAAIRDALRPGEAVEPGPSGGLYLAAERFLIAKYNPAEQKASVAAYGYRAMGDVIVVSGRPQEAKPGAWYVEVGVEGESPTGLKDPDEVAFSQRPNVIFCGRGADAEEAARAIASALEARRPASVPAGWLPDPSGKARLRYWDGQAWTTHTAD